MAGRRRPLAMRRGEFAVLGFGLVAVTVAGVTWMHAGPWPDAVTGSRGTLGALVAGGRGGDRTDLAAETSGAEGPVGRSADASAADGAAADGGQDGGQDGGASDGGTGTNGGSSVSSGSTPGTTGAVGPGGAVNGAAAGPAAPGAARPAAVAPAALSVRTTGRACLLLAPDAAYGAGHNGWAFRRADGTWVEGATENNTPNELVSLWDDTNDDGSFYLEPGADSDSWMRTVGSLAEVRADFRNALSHNGRALHDAGYYTTMRCGDVTTADPGAAYTTGRRVTASGYFIGEDNCLTKAVEVLDAYGLHLPDATYELPSDYLTWRLAPLGPPTPI